MFLEREAYNQIISNTIIQTVDIIFLNKDNQLLLGLRKNPPLKGIYYILGGRRYKNELMLASAQRKAQEEAGIEIDISRLIFLGVYDDIFSESIEGTTGMHCSPITFVYKLNEEEIDKITLDSQHSEYKFFDMNDPTLHDMVKIRISDLENLSL